MEFMGVEFDRNQSMSLLLTVCICCDTAPVSLSKTLFKLQLFIEGVDTNHLHSKKNDNIHKQSGLKSPKFIKIVIMKINWFNRLISLVLQMRFRCQFQFARTNMIHTVYKYNNIIHIFCLQWDPNHKWDKEMRWVAFGVRSQIAFRTWDLLVDHWTNDSDM